MKRQVIHLHKQDSREFYLLLSLGVDQARPEYFKHCLIRHDDALLVHHVLIYLELINCGHIGLC